MEIIARVAGRADLPALVEIYSDGQKFKGILALCLKAGRKDSFATRTRSFMERFLPLK
ncbi:MAG: hypothetical protein JW727_05415 [Candidatus Aenigmarchaeota archaeon]|nr:hypothetical protein [Candidatus Aenigmarchaeota archaeon]